MDASAEETTDSLALFRNDPDSYYAQLRMQALRKAEAEENRPRAQRQRRAKALLTKFSIGGRA